MNIRTSDFCLFLDRNFRRHTRAKYVVRFFSDMAMQLCTRRITQVTSNFVRQFARPITMKTGDDHHTNMATLQTCGSMKKSLLQENTSDVSCM